MAAPIAARTNDALEPHDFRSPFDSGTIDVVTGFDFIGVYAELISLTKVFFFSVALYIMTFACIC